MPCPRRTFPEPTLTSLFPHAFDEMLTTEPEQMKFLAESYDRVNEHAKLLFQYSPAERFSCYSIPLDEVSGSAHACHGLSDTAYVG